MPKKKTEDELYFSSAYIKALENRLIPAHQMDRMAAAETDEFVKLLAGYGYPASEINPSQAHYYDTLVENERGRLFETVFSILSDPAPFYFFLYPYDYLALKALLKAEISGAKAALPKGGMDKGALSSAVSGRIQGPMTEKMFAAMQEALEEVARSQDTQRIDLLLDAACFRDMAESAENSGNEFVKSLVSAMIDTTNIKSFFRLRRMKKGRDFASSVFFDGGSVQPSDYLALYEAPFGELASLFSKGSLCALVQSCAQQLESGSKMGDLERLFDNYLMEFVKEARYLPSGPAVVAAYLYAKETELKNVRIVAAGKAAGLTPDKIRERLRVSYV